MPAPPAVEPPARSESRAVWIVLFCAPFHPWAELERIPEMSRDGWIAAGFLGVFGSFIAFITWAYALSRLQAVTAAMYLFLSSILAALWGWLFNGQAVGWPFGMGAMLVFAGLLVMARSSSSASSKSAPATPRSADASPASAAGAPRSPESSC